MENKSDRKIRVRKHTAAVLAVVLPVLAFVGAGRVAVLSVGVLAVLGGLLAVSVGGQFYLPCYDAYGNVTKYIDESGNVVAAYVYGDFGETLDQSMTLEINGVKVGGSESQNPTKAVKGLTATIYDADGNEIEYERTGRVEYTGGANCRAATAPRVAFARS